MHEQMAVHLRVEDPEGLDPVDAFCVLTEVHMNFKTKMLVGIFECWRSREAFEAKRKSFTAIQMQFESEKGGEAFYHQFGIDGANMQLGTNVREFCMQNGQMFQSATKAEEVNVGQA